MWAVFRAPAIAGMLDGMADPQLSPEAVDELLEEQELDAARTALLPVSAQDESYSVVRIKLALCDGSMPTGAAMQALIQLMRRNPDWPGAKALYQQASANAFESHESSHSHSHPPPPVDRK